MLITPYLDGFKFDLETKRTMGVAFEMTRAALRLSDRDDLVVAMVANRIIELAREGERNPDLLCERASNDLRAAAACITGPPQLTGWPNFPKTRPNARTRRRRRAQHRLGKVRPDGPV
jgi:hypothetical protein